MLKTVNLWKPSSTEHFFFLFLPFPVRMSSVTHLVFSKSLFRVSDVRVAGGGGGGTYVLKKKVLVQINKCV